MNDKPKRFIPERPIYLNEENTKLKTKIEVMLAVEKLRDAGYLCAYGELARPFHLSFNDDKQVNEFKKIAKNLGITLVSKVIQYEDIETLDVLEIAGQDIPGANATASSEDPNGKIHIE